ncbi:MAG: VanZ family protein [Bacteroidetes bacterium]|nr:VanZ family protein [Bacteroidota bacterium]
MYKKIILLLYTALITTLSVMPASDLPDIIVFPYFDKIVHICMYAGLSFLLLWFWDEKKRKNKKLQIIFIVFAWGLFMEIIQGVSHFGRSFDFFDALANTFGFIPGYYSWKIVNRLKIQKSI